MPGGARGAGVVPGGQLAWAAVAVAVVVLVAVAVLAARGIGAGVPGGAGGIGVITGGLGGQELRRHRRAGVFLAGGLGQLLIGDDPGLRVGGHVRPVAVPAGLGGLAGVAGVGVHGRDHPSPH